MDVRVESYTLTSVCFLILLSLTYVTPQDGQFAIRHHQDPLKDFSSKCKEKAILSVFLTLSMGQSDSEVILVSGNDDKNPDCTIKYYTAPGITTILVFEFPDARMYNRPIDCEGIYINLFENNNTNEIYEVCKEVKFSNRTFESLVSTEPLISIAISSDKYFQPLKLTATTTRKIGIYDECDPDTEVLCTRQGEHEVLMLCMSIEVQCDGHLNCGVVDKYDEAGKLCQETHDSILWMVIILGLILFALLSFFLVHLIHRAAPHVGTNFFVFNEDEDNRLNLASVFTQPAERARGVQLSSSSYRFRTSSVLIKSPETGQGRRTVQDHLSRDSEVEVRSEFPASQRRKSSVNSRRDSNKEPKTDAAVSQPNDIKKTHVHIAPVSVDLVPDYDLIQHHENVITDVAPKSILGHGHDQMSFPETPMTKGPRDIEVIKVPKKKKALKDVRSSKDLISRKVHHTNDFEETEEKPPRPGTSHRKSGSDSDN